jgi:proteasome lid subunit RPN8/RPN11
MAFSLKVIIRAFVAPDHRLRCSSRLWRNIVAELERRGETEHEAGAFLLGLNDGIQKEVREAVYYDELEPRAYDSGVCVLHGDAFARLWSLCREKNLTVVADAHTHPGAAFQSATDRTNPMVARDGHVAIIVPDFARWPIEQGALGVYEYAGDHTWRARGGRNESRYFYRGFWA